MSYINAVAMFNDCVTAVSLATTYTVKAGVTFHVLISHSNVLTALLYIITTVILSPTPPKIFHFGH